MSSAIVADISELRKLLALAKRPLAITLLTDKIGDLEASLEKAEDTPPPAPVPVPAASPAPAPAVTTTPPAATTQTYHAIDKFLLDVGDYNSKFVTLYIELPDVADVKDTVTCHFKKGSFDLIVPNLAGKSYRLFKDNLEHDINPTSCKFLVKAAKVVIKLAKCKGEFAIDSWTGLTAKKDKTTKSKAKEDPQSSIMVRARATRERSEHSSSTSSLTSSTCAHDVLTHTLSGHDEEHVRRWR